MAGRFVEEYRKMDLFVESSYPADFDYALRAARFDTLNFAYLVDSLPLQALIRASGLSHDLMEEEVEEGNQQSQGGRSQEGGSATGDAARLRNEQLVDQAATVALGFRSRNPTFAPLALVVRPELDASEAKMLTPRVYNLLRELMPGLRELRRVVYRAPDGLKLEVNLPIVRILCLSNDDVKSKNASYMNLGKYLRTTQISKFVNQSDLVALCKEAAHSMSGGAQARFETCRILLPDMDDLEYAKCQKLLTGKMPVVEVGEGESLATHNIYADCLIVFYFRERSEPWAIDFKPPEEAPLPNRLLEIEAAPEAPASRRCSSCKTIIERDARFARVCVCGTRYCSPECKRKDLGHRCEAKSCASCARPIKVDAAACDCGVVYCDSDCQAKDEFAHKKSCKAAERSAGRSRGGYESYGYLRRDSYVEEELLEAENGGKIGLSNIGNTCYMNSALQCCLHTDFLKSFFLDFDYKNEVNDANVFGTKGELLLELGSLFRVYYTTPNSKLTPYRFKSVLAKHNNTFEGYAQHDSQELLSCLLDAVHEDTNRVRTKPYVESLTAKPSDDDYVVARKSWINHLKRNYSKIVQNFTGQFKSVVECPRCANTSVTFDPYNLISLGIPTVAAQDFEVYFISEDHAGKAEKHAVSVRSLHNFVDIPLAKVLEAFSEKLGVAAAKLRFALLGFEVVGDVCRPTDTVARLLEAKQLPIRPKAFVIELNEEDMAALARPDPLVVLLKTDHEGLDVDPKIDRQSFEFHRAVRDTPKDPIFSKVFYVSGDRPVRDLYECVLRKLISATSLLKKEEGSTEKAKPTQSFYAKYWDMIETKLKDRRFFYLKSGGKLLSGPLLNRPIREVCEVSEGKLLLNAYIRTKANCAVDVDLERFLACTTAAVRGESGLVFASSDLDQYKKEYSLEFLLDNFSRTEVLDAANTWYCGVCKDHVQARKTIEIYKVPNYLVLHLKKLKTAAKQIPLITFPIDCLDMQPFVLNPTPLRSYNVAAEEFFQPQDLAYYQEAGKNPLLEEQVTSSGLRYKLYGVVNHFGSQHFGHYTAYGEVAEGQWAEFNDSSVSAASKKDIISDGAYILFYKRI